jgi:hypothetical protein
MSQLTLLKKQVKRYAVMLEGLPDTAANFGLLTFEFNIDQVRCIRVLRSYARWDWAKSSYDQLQCEGDINRLIIGQALQCTIKYGRAEKITSKNSKETTGAKQQ